jgi:hypothetical protein
LLTVARGPRVAYLTVGHNERDTTSGSDKRLGLSDFKTLLESEGFTVKRLGLGEGLGQKVPDDARLVIVPGPIDALLPAEVTALHTWVDAGGRLMVMVDPDQGDPLDSLLQPYGVKLDKGLVASDKMLVRVEGRTDSPYNFATTKIVSHPAVTTLDKAAGRMGVVFLGAGSLVQLTPPPPGKKVSTLVRAPDAWVDADGNGRFDADKEKKSAADLVVAVANDKPKGKEPAPTEPEPRVIIIADADAAGTGVLRSPGNAYLYLDSLKWLAGDEEIAGEISSEEDVPLVHKKEGDAVWFYGSSFFVPAAVLGGGLLFTRRRQRRS